MKIAYLSNLYPKISHSFIRREILALESLGVAVSRYTIRVWDQEIIDAIDRQELTKTRVILQAGFLTLLANCLKTVFSSPQRFWQALRLTWRVGRHSARGLLINLMYLVEACTLKQWLGADHIKHLHVHFGTNPATVAMLCNVLGGPGYSVTIHGPEEFDTGAAIALSEKIKRARFVVAISSYGRSQLYRWCDYQDWRKIHLVHCGVDQNFLATEPTPLPDQPNLVCVGRLSEQKGQLLLLQAVAMLVKRKITLKLVLVGDGHLRPVIETAIADLKLENFVEMTGRATEQTVKTQINAAKAMILPSFAEGLPVVLMESLAMGRPVISTYIAGIPELIEPGVCGWLVPAGDINALVETMQTALATPLATLTQMGLQGRQQVIERHDVVKAAKLLADLFSQYVQ